jgi:hypothetical protein
MKQNIKKILREYVEEREIQQINSVMPEDKVIVKPAGHKGNGLFATQDIKKGEIFLSAQGISLSNEDWKKVMDTIPVEMYSFIWGNEHIVPIGPWPFNFTNPEDKKKWMSTDFAKEHCPNGKLMLSGFLYINDIDKNTKANSKEVFNDYKDLTGMVATRNIKKGEEIIKQYTNPGEWRN